MDAGWCLSTIDDLTWTIHICICLLLVCGKSITFWRGGSNIIILLGENKKKKQAQNWPHKIPNIVNDQLLCTELIKKLNKYYLPHTSSTIRASHCIILNVANYHVPLPLIHIQINEIVFHKCQPSQRSILHISCKQNINSPLITRMNDK